jgi:hypothetical protein
MPVREVSFLDFLLVLMIISESCRFWCSPCFLAGLKQNCMSAHSSEETTDVKKIQQWAEKRGGKPSKVKSTAHGKNDGLIRIDFPGYSGGDSLEEISWEEWGKIFKDSGLKMIYQEHTADGKESNFNKLVSK